MRNKLIKAKKLKISIKVKIEKNKASLTLV